MDSNGTARAIAPSMLLGNWKGSQGFWGVLGNEKRNGQVGECVGMKGCSWEMHGRGAGAAVGLILMSSSYPDMQRKTRNCSRAGTGQAGAGEMHGRDPGAKAVLTW